MAGNLLTTCRSPVNHALLLSRPAVIVACVPYQLSKGAKGILTMERGKLPLSIMR